MLEGIPALSPKVLIIWQLLGCVHPSVNTTLSVPRRPSMDTRFLYSGTGSTTGTSLHTIFVSAQALCTILFSNCRHGRGLRWLEEELNTLTRVALVLSHCAYRLQIKPRNKIYAMLYQLSYEVLLEAGRVRVQFIPII